MAKKAKGNRVQVILECTEHKDSGMPVLLVISLLKTERINSAIGIDEIQSDSEEDDFT